MLALARGLEFSTVGSRRAAAEWVPFLRTMPLFAGVSHRHLCRLVRCARFRRFAPHSTVTRAGEEGRAFYLIIDGEVQLLANGHVTHLVEGDFFGEMSIIDGAPQVATVVTVTEMLAMQLERGPFVRMIGSEPSVSLGIMKELVSTVRGLEDGYGRRELQGLTHAAVGHAPYG